MTYIWKGLYGFSVRHDYFFSFCVIIFLLQLCIFWLYSFFALTYMVGSFQLTKYAVDLSLKGSPYWMAPEVPTIMFMIKSRLCLLSNLFSYISPQVLQSMMRKDSNPELAFAVDIWSVGCTVIEMLTGKPPWSEYNGVSIMQHCSCICYYF